MDKTASAGGRLQPMETQARDGRDVHLKYQSASEGLGWLVGPGTPDYEYVDEMPVRWVLHGLEHP